MENLFSSISQFHFIRPAWLLALIPAIGLFLLLWNLKHFRSSWSQVISPTLLPFLMDTKDSQKQQHLPWALLLTAWIISTLAIAGPAWNKLPQTIFKSEQALVIVLDLSMSMLATDVAPNRLTRTQHKLTDILNQRQEGLTALVVFAGDAHTVTPLTDDTDTIINTIPALSPNIMPLLGSQPEQGIETALQLLKDGGINSGQILLISDGIEDNAIDNINSLLSDHKFNLSILGVGTEQGSPIPLSNGNFFKDNNGTIIVPKLTSNAFQQLANDNNGRFTTMQINDTDIDFLLSTDLSALNDSSRETEREFDVWQEQGPWLLLLILPIAALSFRRGWLFILPLAFFMQPQASYALSWNDLWNTQNQQATKALQQGDTETAAQLFNDSQWQGTAQYRSSDFQAAAENFSQQDTASSHYNRGNALAKAQQLEDAISAYDKALALDPNFEDAQFNKQLVEQLQQQEQEQEEESEDSEQSEDSEDSEDNDQQQESDESQDDSEQQPQDESQEQSQEEPSDSNPEDQQSEEQSDEEQPSENESEQEKKEQEAEQQESEDGEQQEQQMSQVDEPTTEEQQALEQWLRRVPDDPGGLLRNKFKIQTQINQQQHPEKYQQDQKMW